MGTTSVLLLDLGVRESHEGWVEGFASDGTLLTYKATHDREGEVLPRFRGNDVPVPRVRAGCDCGWRGPTVPAPEGTVWWPSIVEFPRHPKDDERSWGWHDDRVMEAWQEHVRAIARDVAPTGITVDERLQNALARLEALAAACERIAPHGAILLDEPLRRARDFIRRERARAGRAA